MNRFFSIDEINTKIHLLSERFGLIQSEFLQNKHKLIWTNWDRNNSYTNIDESPYAGWKISPLIFQDNNLSRYSLQKNYKQSVKFDYKSGVFLFQNSEHLPILISTLLECGIKKRVGISVVFPNKEIKWHTDPDPETKKCAIIRGLWGLDVQNDDSGECFLCLGDENNHEKRVFKNNEFMFFWGRTMHMVSNTLKTPRYALCFDQDVSREYLLNLGN
jgi:hypothetical protein